MRNKRNIAQSPDVHDTSQATNRHFTNSTTTFEQLMGYYGMAGTRCNATVYDAGGRIKHSMYNIAASHTLSKVAPSDTALVLWDNAADLEDMATSEPTTIRCSESRGQGPRAKLVLEYKPAGSTDMTLPTRNTIGTIKIVALTNDKFTNNTSTSTRRLTSGRTCISA